MLRVIAFIGFAYLLLVCSVWWMGCSVVIRVVVIAVGECGWVDDCCVLTLCLLAVYYLLGG